MSNPGQSELKRLWERTRQLLDDQEPARQDLLSVSDLNRMLRQVLQNQTAILKALATLSSSPRADTAPDAPRITLRERTEAADAPPERGLDEDEGDRCFTDALASAATPREGNGRATRAPASGASSATAEVLDEVRSVSGPAARVFVEEFDNRDNNYDKGLEKLNRWIEGSLGTPFQMRGDRAYLNVKGGGPDTIRRTEENLIERLGFNRRLGRLVVPGLAGEIVVYERT